MGISLSESGFLVVKDAQNSSSLPALIGMNIIGRCRPLVHAEFDSTLGGSCSLTGGRLSSRCRVLVGWRSGLW